MIRLVDGTRVCLHAVVDNFSRRILAWQVNEEFEAWTSVNLLVAAGRGLGAGARIPTLLADAGVENRNRSVDRLIEAGHLKRVLPRTEISLSNSLIEA